MTKLERTQKMLTLAQEGSLTTLRHIVRAEMRKVLEVHEQGIFVWEEWHHALEDLQAAIERHDPHMAVAILEDLHSTLSSP